MRLSTRTAIKSLILILSSTAIALAIAPAPVTPNALADGCASYLGWNSSTNTAGPFTVVADSTGSSIDGNPASVESFTNDGKDIYGFITLPKAAPRLGGTQNLTIRCSASQLQVQVRSSWVDVYVAEQENWQSSFSFGLSTPSAPGIPVQAYQHLVDGKLADGVFLGAGESTTWTFKYNWGGNAGEYYILRWVKDPAEVRRIGKRQGEFPVLDDRDWVGFLKVAG